MSKVTINALEELPNVGRVDHVVLVMEANYGEVVSSVYKAAREAGRYVAAGQSIIHGVLTFHLFLRPTDMPWL